MINLDHQPTMAERASAGIPWDAVCVQGSSLMRLFVYEALS